VGFDISIIGQSYNAMVEDLSERLIGQISYGIDVG